LNAAAGVKVKGGSAWKLGVSRSARQEWAQLAQRTVLPLGPTRASSTK
jgi:hypothetical protein